MKKYVFISIFISLMFTGIVSIGLSHGMGNKVQTKKILSVGNIQADPLAFKGAITINGVVAGRSQDDPKLFAIIDTAEVKACKVTSCGRFYLQVRYEGKIPVEGDEINVTGSFEQKKILFNATNLEVLRHLNVNGGK